MALIGERRDKESEIAEQRTPPLNSDTAAPPRESQRKDQRPGPPSVPAYASGDSPKHVSVLVDAVTVATLSSFPATRKIRERRQKRITHTHNKRKRESKRKRSAKLELKASLSLLRPVLGRAGRGWQMRTFNSRPSSETLYTPRPPSSDAAPYVPGKDCALCSCIVLDGSSDHRIQRVPSTNGPRQTPTANQPASQSDRPAAIRRGWSTPSGSV